MPLIDIHTHHTPVEAGSFFVRNVFPEDDTLLLPPGGFYSVGLHPWYITNNHDHREQFLELEKKAALPEVVAVGECGLDKLANTESQLQLEVFIRQCELAEQLNKPLVIHCVKAYNELFHLKRKLKPKVPWILHGYYGNGIMTGQLVSQNFYFSFGKMLISDKSLSQSLALIPREKIFFETDEWKHPVEKVYKKYAELSGLAMDELKNQVMWNFRQVFIRE